jgi:hypothetical protein
MGNRRPKTLSSATSILKDFQITTKRKFMHEITRDVLDTYVAGV